MDCEAFICNWRILLRSSNRLCCTENIITRLIRKQHGTLRRTSARRTRTTTNLGKVGLERFQRVDLVRDRIFDEILNRQVQMTNPLFGRPQARRFGHGSRSSRRGTFSRGHVKRSPAGRTPRVDENYKKKIENSIRKTGAAQRSVENRAKRKNDRRSAYEELRKTDMIVLPLRCA